MPGQVAALHVDDNQLVQKGDLLVELDATPYQALATNLVSLYKALGGGWR